MESSAPPYPRTLGCMVGNIRPGLPSKWSEFPAVWVYFLHPDLIFVPARFFLKESARSCGGSWGRGSRWMGAEMLIIRKFKLNLYWESGHLMLCLNPKRLKDTIFNQFGKMPHYRPFHSFFNFLYGKVHKKSINTTEKSTLKLVKLPNLKVIHLKWAKL